MLHVSNISHTDAYMEQWKKERLGKITASLVGKLVSKDSHNGKFAQTAMSYIEGLAGERVTGTPAKPDWSNSNTDHGNATEPEAIAHFCKQYNKVVMRNEDRADTHRLIIPEGKDGYTACTPDALVCLTGDERFIFDESGEYLKVAPLETKCPPVLHRFIKLYKCLTPADLKQTEPDYYYQSLFQLICCDSLVGYFGAYNPVFPLERRMRVLTFKKMELVEDIKKLKLTIHHAKLEIEKIVKLFN